MRSHLDNQDSLERSDILSICCSLVIHDDETNTFRFAHLSVLEYLERLENYSKPSATSLLAEQCLSWIMTKGDLLEQERMAYRRLFQKTPTWPQRWQPPSDHLAINLFSGHADVYWPQYSRFAGHLRSRGRLKLLLETFLLSDTHVTNKDVRHFHCWTTRLDTRRTFYQQTLIISPPADPLFIATASNLNEIVATRIHKKPDALRGTNSFNFNCAQVAACCDQPETLCMILQEIRRLLFPREYMKCAMVEAATMGKASSLAVIFEVAGSNFVSSDDLQRIVNEAWRTSRDSYATVMT